MSSFSSYVLSIAGVTILSVVVDLLISNGKMQKYVKSVFSFVFILVIIMPLPSLFKKNTDFDDLFNHNQFVLQNDYIYQLNRDRLDDLKRDIEEIIFEEGISNVKVSISANIFTTELKIDGVFVDISAMVIISDNKHINTNDIIVKAVQSRINLGKESIVFCE